MPNMDYDTRTPEEKKKLMKGKLKFDPRKDKDPEQETPGEPEQGSERGPLHRHTA